MAILLWCVELFESLLGFGFGASASYWSEGSITSYHVAPSVTREMGASHARGAFQVYGSAGPLGDVTYCGTELSFTFPLGRGAAGSPRRGSGARGPLNPYSRAVPRVLA